MMTELTDKELDAVSGGSTIVLSALNQQNFANTVGVAVNAATVLSDVLGVVERAGNALYGARVYLELGRRLAHAQAAR